MSTVTIQAMAALRLRHSRKAFIDAFEAMPAEKQSWRPALGAGSGRSARELVQECVLTNTTFAAMIRDGIEPDIDWRGELTKLAEIESGALVKQFQTGNEELAELIESMTDDHLERTFLWPWAEREVTFAEFAFIPAWHLDYHAGQINYIQTLYGDGDDHSAPA